MPALIVRSVGMNFAAMGASHRIATFLSPLLLPGDLRSRWRIRGCARVGGGLLLLSYCRSEFHHGFIVCLDECLNLLGMFFHQFCH